MGEEEQLPGWIAEAEQANAKDSSLKTALQKIGARLGEPQQKAVTPSEPETTAPATKEGVALPDDDLWKKVADGKEGAREALQ